VNKEEGGDNNIYNYNNLLNIKVIELIFKGGVI
jgi:hypothetical protein